MAVGISDLKTLFPRQRGSVDPHFCTQRFRGQGVCAAQFVQASFKNNLTAQGAGTGPHLNDVIRQRKHLPGVFHHEYIIVLVPQRAQQLSDPFRVRGMQAGSRFIKDIRNVVQITSQVPDHFQPLCFAA